MNTLKPHAVALTVFVLISSAASTVSADDDDFNPAPWVLAGVGAAVIAGGSVFAVLASGAYDDARSDPVQMSAADSLSQGDTFATVGNLLLISGAVIVVSGVAWGAVELQPTGSSGEQATLRLSPGGLVLDGRF